MEYSLGRESLLSFVDDPVKRPNDYYQGIYHFTASIGQAWQFCDLNLSMSKERTGSAKPKIYHAGDESLFEKLNLIHNDSKHVVASYNATHQPIRLTNSGIVSAKADLPFCDLKEFLETMSKYCAAVLEHSEHTH